MPVVKGNSAEQLWLWPGQERKSTGSWIQKDEENCQFSLSGRIGWLQGLLVPCTSDSGQH